MAQPRYGRVSRSLLVMQCLGVAASAVTACTPVVQKWHTVPPPPAPAAKDFNLQWTGVDENGVPLNPFWSPQQTDRTHLPPTSKACSGSSDPFSSGCSDQRAARDPARGLNAIICSLDPGTFHGHADWSPALLTGYLTWSNWASDYDINFVFIPDDQFGGLTACNETVEGDPSPCDSIQSGHERYIELEYAADEFLNPVATAWWSNLRTAANTWAQAEGPVPDVGAALNNAHPGNAVRASVFGLFGLDCEHGCKSEVHPVYALAIQTDDNPRNERWAVIARNWGTEGFCSQENHVIDSPHNNFRIRLPHPGADHPPQAVAEDFAANYDNIPQPHVDLQRNVGAIVTLALPPADSAGLVEFVVRLDWGESAPALRAQRRAPSAAVTKPTQTGAEGILEQATRNATPAAARLNRAALQLESRPKPGGSKQLPVTAITVGTYDPSNYIPDVTETARGLTKQVPAQKKVADQDLIRRICAANHGTLPKLSATDSAKVCTAAK